MLILLSRAAFNDAGQVVGDFYYSTGLSHAFLYNYGGYKSFQTYAAPGATANAFYGINGSGQFVGQFADSTGALLGFTWNAGTDGSDVVLPIPYAFSINNNGQLPVTIKVSTSYTRKRPVVCKPYPTTPRGYGREWH